MTNLRHLGIDFDFPYPGLVEVYREDLTREEIMQHGMLVASTDKVMVPLSLALKAADRKLRKEK